MGLSSGFESNALGGLGAGFGSGGFGGAGFGFGGGFGGIPPVGLFGLMGLGNRDGHHEYSHEGHDGALFMMTQLSQVKDTVVNAKDSLDQRVDSARDSLAEKVDNAKDALTNRVDATKDALTSRIESTKDKVTDEARGLAKDICDMEKSNLQQFYAQAIQAERNTAEIKNQAQAFQIANDRKFEELSREGDRNTALILAKINQDTIDELREKLELSRRRVEAKEQEINITNTNTNIQQQMQQQQQQQLQNKYELDRKFDVLFSQVAKSSQDIINVGGLMAGVAQAANPVNVKS